MAEFSRLVITKKGQALIAKILAGTASNVEFTKIAASKHEYSGVDELELLIGLPDIMQEVEIGYKCRTNDVAVQIETAFSNKKLTIGYPMNTLGLFAIDPDEGEILYAACMEVSGYCFMPPNNGLTLSGAHVKLITTVGNADSVSFEVNPATSATFADIKRLQEQIDELKGKTTGGTPFYIGANEPETSPAFWFNTGAVPAINTVVFLKLGGEEDVSDITATIDGKDRPVMNANVDGTNADHVSIKIEK